MWFHFCGVLMHAARTMKYNYEILQSLLKVLSMFKLRIWYETDNTKKSSRLHENQVHKV